MASADQTTLTRREAAELLGTSERNVRRLIEMGRLPVHPGPKGARLLRRDDVLRYRARTADAVPQEQAARLLDVDVRTVRRMLKDGRLAAIRMESGRLRVSRPSLDSLLADDNGQADATGHPDATGHFAAVTGHFGNEADTTGQTDAIAPAWQPDIADQLVPVDDLAPLEPPPSRRPARRDNGRHRRIGALAAAAVLTGAVMFTFALARHDGVTSRTIAVETPLAPAVTPPPVATATVSREVAPTPTVAPSTSEPATTVPKMRGGAAKLVSAPVRRTKVRRPQPAATLSGGTAPAATPAPARSVDPVCEDVYGPEGLC